MKKICIIVILILLLSVPATAVWNTNTNIINGLVNEVDSSSPDVFCKDTNLYLLTGNGDGTFHGYTWNGSSWVSNSSIINGLGDIGSTGYGNVFKINDTYYLIVGRDAGARLGYVWDGSQWISNSTIINGIDVTTSLWRSKSFYIGNNLYLIAGVQTLNVFYGYEWNGSGWVVNNSIKNGIIGGKARGAPTGVFNKDGTLYNIVGNGFWNNADDRGFQFDGNQWFVNAGLDDNLQSNQERVIPTVFNINGEWFLILGQRGPPGSFQGFKLDSTSDPSFSTCEAPTPPQITSWSNNYTNNNQTNITVPTFTAVKFNATANQSIDTWTWKADGVDQSNNYDNFSKYFDSDGSSNVSVYGTNTNGSTQTITWNITTITNVTCQIGWCFVGNNYSSTTPYFMSLNYSSTIQGHYNSGGQKYETHFNNSTFNRNVAISQKEGMYFYFTNQTTVEITIPESHSITLNVGWNLVANFGTTRNLSQLRDSITDATNANYYNRTSKSWVSTNSTNVPTGESFFVYVTSSSLWTG